MWTKCVHCTFIIAPFDAENPPFLENYQYLHVSPALLCSLFSISRVFETLVVLLVFGDVRQILLPLSLARDLAVA